MNPLAVITGTSSGIGKTLALGLLEKNWDVVGIARREGAIAHENYHHVRLDLTRLEQVAGYFEQTLPREVTLAGRPKVALVNNSGVLDPVGPVEDLPLEQLATAFTLNSAVPLWLMGCMTRMVGDAPLTMINISSGAATKPLAGWAAYCSTKAALLMAGRAYGEDIAHNARYRTRRARLAVVSYSPGVTNTPMQDQVRTFGTDAFPGVDRFIQLKEAGEVKGPELPVAEMMALLERDDLPPFSDVTYGKKGG